MAHRMTQHCLRYDVSLNRVQCPAPCALLNTARDMFCFNHLLTHGRATPEGGQPSSAEALHSALMAAPRRVQYYWGP
eukprot:11866440-Alexandrium_andersonii.AAC.1